jgi:hypothetical protein
VKDECLLVHMMLYAKSPLLHFDKFGVMPCALFFICGCYLYLYIYGVTNSFVTVIYYGVTNYFVIVIYFYVGISLYIKTHLLYFLLIDSLYNFMTYY